MTENSFRKTIQELYPDTAPSPQLVERVTKLAVQADTKKQSARRWQLPITLSVGFAAVATVTFAVVVLLPRITLARTLKEVSENLAHVPRTHFRLTMPSSKSILEFWTQGNYWREDYSFFEQRMTQIHADGKDWNYFPDKNEATFTRSTENISYTRIDPEKLRTDTSKMLRDPNAQNFGEETRNGLVLQKVVTPGPVQTLPFAESEKGRNIFWIDKTQMLPVQTEGQVLKNGKWVTVQRIEYNFTEPIPKNVFEIPTDVRTYDLAAYGAKVGQRFAQPIQQQTKGTTTIAIRDVQVNRDGDVFVLFTDGSTRDKDKQTYPDMPTDDWGTVYTGTAGGIEAFMYCSEKSSSRGITVGKLVMQGLCVVPVVPRTGEAPPRKINLDFHFVEYVGKKAYTRKKRFTIPVTKPIVSLLPDYSKDLDRLSLAGGNPKQFKQERESARRSHLSNKGDWAGVIRSSDREIATKIADIHTYLDRATAFQNLRQWTAAEDAIRQAERTDESNYYTDQIAQARKELQTSRTRQ